jgi:hypothetical protein
MQVFQSIKFLAFSSNMNILFQKLHFFLLFFYFFYFQKTMDITPDHVKEEKDMDSLPDDQSPAQDFCNVAAGQEYGLESLTRVFLKEETVEEQRSEIDLSTQVIIKESAHTKLLLNKTLTPQLNSCYF